MKNPTQSDSLAATKDREVRSPSGSRDDATPDTAATKGPVRSRIKRLPRGTQVRADPPKEQTRSSSVRSRDGKTMIAGYFTPEMARAVKTLAAERNTTVQALIGEGLDRVLETYGKAGLGER